MRLLLVSVVEVSSPLTGVGGVGVDVDLVNDQNDPHLVLQFGNSTPASTTLLLSVDLANSTAL